MDAEQTERMLHIMDRGATAMESIARSLEKEKKIGPTEKKVCGPVEKK